MATREAGCIVLHSLLLPKDFSDTLLGGNNRGIFVSIPTSEQIGCPIGQIAIFGTPSPEMLPSIILRKTEWVSERSN
jgi:hypothetical protein